MKYLCETTAIPVDQSTVEMTVDLVRHGALSTMTNIDPRTAIHAQSEGVAVTLEIVADLENGNNRATTVNCGPTMAKSKMKLVLWAV